MSIRKTPTIGQPKRPYCLRCKKFILIKQAIPKSGTKRGKCPDCGWVLK